MSRPSAHATTAHGDSQQPCVQPRQSSAYPAAPEHRVLGAGELIYAAGEPATALFVLTTGRVRLTRKTAKGVALVTGLLRPGALFGLDSLTDRTHSETAAAEVGSTIRAVTVETVDRLLKRQPGFAAGVLEALVRRRTAVEGLLTRALITGVPGRLAGALLDAADGNVVAGLTRQQLAETAWTTRETATRVLFHFQEGGLVVVEGRSIQLLDPRGLRRLAAGARQAAAA